MILLNHQHLYYFWTAAKEGSITKASKKLFLTQATISDQIIQLEKYLGHRLLERNKKRLGLTEEGKVVLGYANDIFDITKELVNSFRGGAQVSQPGISIGIDDNMSRQTAFRLLKETCQHVPPIEFTVYEGLYKDHIDHLRTHSLDLVFSDQSEVEDEGEYLKSEVGRLEMFFMAPPELSRLVKEFPRDLAKVPLVLPVLASPISASIEKFFIHRKIKPHILGRIQDVELMKLMVLRGLAVAPLHEVAATNELKEGVIIRLGNTPTGITKTLWLIAKKRRRMNPLVLHLLKNFRIK